MNIRLVEMIARGRLPFRGGQWIDTYNQITNPDCAGTIIAGINAKNHYYVMEEMKEPIVLEWTRDEKGNVVDRHPVEVANAVTAAKRDNTQNYVIEQRGRGFNQGGKHEICPTISANSFEYNNHVLERIDGENDYPTYRTEKGVKIKKVFPESVKTKILPIPENYRIRKLTPRECFRLMGVSDADIDKIQAAGISKSQQYKMAGNSIVVNCLAAIFRQLFIGNFNKVIQTEIF